MRLVAKLAAVAALVVLACVPALAQNVPTDFVTSGNLTTNGQCITAYVGQGQNSVAISVSGTWTGTVTFKTLDPVGSTYTVTPALPRGGGTAVTSTTANGVWVLGATATKQVQACATAAMTGTAAVNLESSVTVTPSSAFAAGSVTATISGTVATSGSGTTTAETLACPSPCTVAANNVVVANANPSRSQCVFQSTGTALVYGCYNASTCTTTTYDFCLSYPGATATGCGGQGTSYQIGPQATIWRGGLTFASTAGGQIVGNCY